MFRRTERVLQARKTFKQIHNMEMKQRHECLAFCIECFDFSSNIFDCNLSLRTRHEHCISPVRRTLMHVTKLFLIIYLGDCK